MHAGQALCFVPVSFYLILIASCVSAFCKETEPQGYVYMWRFIWRNWLTQLWRPRNPTIHNLQTGGSGIIHSESEGLRARGADGANPSPRTGENEVGYPSLDSEALPVVLFRPSTDWMMPPYIGEGRLLHSVHPFRCEPHLETSS